MVEGQKFTNLLKIPTSSMFPLIATFPLVESINLLIRLKCVMLMFRQASGLSWAEKDKTMIVYLRPRAYHLKIVHLSHVRLNISSINFVITIWKLKFRCCCSLDMT